MSLRSIEVINVQTDTYGNTVYELFLPKEKFVFENLDLSQYDVERELGAYPYAVLRLEYHRPDVLQGKTILPVGWARVPLFRRGAGSGRASTDPVWVMLAGDNIFTLHPGDISESITSSVPKTPTERMEGSLIGYNSELSAVVYDPRNEPADSPLPVPQVAPADTRQTPRYPRHVTPRREPAPLPEPVSPSPLPSETSPEPEPVPTPPNLEEDPSPWVEQKPKSTAMDPSPSSNSQPFDLYVDGIRFIPDSATIVKVTGRLLRTGEIGDLPDILAVPDLDSDARSPRFHYRLTVNADRKAADPNLLILLRAYTIDVISERIMVIGSCLFGIFDVKGKNKGTLRVGGHQLRLRSGMPDIKAGVDSLKPSSLDFAPPVPGCSILVRLRPHEEEPVEALKYSVGYYRSESCRPNTSENRIFASYSESMQYPAKERDMVKRLQAMEGITEGRSDVSLTSWLKDRLDIKKQMPAAQPASNLSLTRCVRYRTKLGFRVKIDQAFGMPEDKIIQCFARIAPGNKVLGMPSTRDGYGKEEKFITEHHLYESLFQAPAWVDQAKELHPFYDDSSCLIVQVFGLDVVYQMKPDHKAPGRLVTQDGTDLDLKENSILGWAVVPLFDGNSVLNGIHRVPVLKNNPSAEILEQLSTASVQSVLEGHNWNSDNAFEAGSLKITVWDGHYDFAEIPEMPVYDNLLEKVGEPGRYREAQQAKVGRHLNSVVLENLEPKYRKQGIKGAVYKKEMQFLEDLLSKTFYDLIENALLTSGYGPL